MKMCIEEWEVSTAEMAAGEEVVRTIQQHATLCEPDWCGRCANTCLVKSRLKWARCLHVHTPLEPKQLRVSCLQTQRQG